MTDARFRYVPFKDLCAADREAARRRWVHGCEWLPDEEYQYPVRKDGRLTEARAQRYIPYERAVELHDEWQVRRVMLS